MQIFKNKEFLLAEKFNKEGKYEEALHILLDLEQNRDFSITDRISFDLLKGSVMVRLGQYNEVFTLSERISQECQNYGKKLLLVDSFILQSKALYWLRRYDDGLNIIEQAETLLKTLVDESSYNIKQREAWIAWGRGVIYMEKGERALQLKHLEKGLTFGEETGIREISFLCLMLLGNYYTYEGDYDQAISYLNRSLEMTKLMQNHPNTAWCLSILISIHYKRGELDLCIKYIKKAYILFKKTNNILHGSNLLHYLGAIYLDKGKFNRASRYLERCLAIYEEIGDLPLRTCFLLTDLIYLALEKGDFGHSDLYFKHLKKIYEKEKNQKVVNLEYKFNQAIILKKDPRQINLLKAKALLVQIINEEFIDNSLYNLALLELCDILLINLKTTNDLKIIDKIRPFLNKLIEITKKSQSYWLLAETYLLQAKIELITLDLNEARRSLIKAHKTAEKFGLNLLILRILDEKNELETQFTKWENFRNSKAIIAERIDLARIDNQLVRMLRKRLSLEKVAF